MEIRLVISSFFWKVEIDGLNINFLKKFWQEAFFFATVLLCKINSGSWNCNIDNEVFNFSFWCINLLIKWPIKIKMWMLLCNTAYRKILMKSINLRVFFSMFYSLDLFNNLILKKITCEIIFLSLESTVIEINI